MNYRNHDFQDGWYVLGFFVGAIILAALAVSFQAWLIGLVLGWFGIHLAFWKCLVISLLLGSIFGASRAN